MLSNGGGKRQGEDSNPWQHGEQRIQTTSFTVRVFCKSDTPQAAVCMTDRSVNPRSASLAVTVSIHQELS